MTEELTARERRQARTRESILNAAIELIMEAGIDNLQMRELAERVDYSIGGLYAYFGSKDEIVEAVCVEGETRLSAYLGAVPLDQPVEDYLQALGTAYINYARNNPQYFKLTFSYLQAGAQEYTREPDIPPEGSYRLLLNGIQRGIEQGVFNTREGYGLDEMAYSLWALVHGLAVLQSSYLSGVAFNFEQADQHAMATFIRGLIQ